MNNLNYIQLKFREDKIIMFVYLLKYGIYEIFLSRILKRWWVLPEEINVTYLCLRGFKTSLEVHVDK